ncbi:MAG: leucine-rich repeat protein, partial [Muribaculaceae bacterium]|nr:leucine-rich repeat protein [Muribaculaceae bacterium]
GEGAFNSCTSLTSVEIGNSVTSIGDYAFSNCSSLTSVIIGNSVTSIGEGAFVYCSSLTSIQIPNSVTSIGEWALGYCSSLTSIEIGNSVTSIGNNAFAYCESLTNIVVDYDNAVYESRNGCNAIIETASNTLIAGCKNTIIPNGVTSIGDRAFNGCSSLTSIQIPNSVTSIGDWAFAYCSGLSSIEIPNSVTSIGDRAFYGCSSLTKITCLATNPPAIVSTTFSNYSAELYVPAGCKSAYQSAIYWNNFNIKEIVTLSTSIALNQTTATLKATETITLIATILPENATDKSVEWSSSDETVAVVDENGVVTAISIGEAVITATTADGSNLSASCKVTVAPTLAVSIELDQTEASVEEKSKFQLTATILPEHTTNKEVAWSSSDKWVASVDNTGLVTMYSAGEVIITATTTDGTNLSATCHINVYSGIDGVEGDDVIVATVGDNIVVKNAKLGSVVNVYASNGALVATEVATEGDVIIEAPAKGVYVVKVGKQTVKVII